MKISVAETFNTVSVGKTRWNFILRQDINHDPGCSEYQTYKRKLFAQKKPEPSDIQKNVNVIFNLNVYTFKRCANFQNISPEPFTGHHSSMLSNHNNISLWVITLYH